MVEETARFRIKKGEVEIEYEGNPDEVNTKYQQAFQWIKTSISSEPKKQKEKKSANKLSDDDNKKLKKRGGRRSSIISPEIDKIIEEGFFKDFKNEEQVCEELKRKAIPVSSYNAVSMALKRRVGKTLDRIKDQNEKWVYREKNNG